MPEEKFLLYFLASLRARKYEIKLSTKVEHDPKWRHLPYFVVREYPKSFQFLLQCFKC